MKEREKVMLDWCKSNNKSIGGKESSQAFLWRALDFLKQNGKAGMLVSAGVLFKHSSTTAAFRKQWLRGVCLKEVINFVHVRKFFFKGVNSPFVMIHFSKSEQGSVPVEYWSAKQVTAIKEIQAVLLSKYDRNILTDEDLTDGKIWKSYWFGRHADRTFFQQLGYLRRLSEFVDRKNSGRGYQTYTNNKSGDQLGCDNTLVSMCSKYDDLKFSESPEHVYNIGPIKAYKGYKIVVSEGIKESRYPKGQIIARFETSDFSFYRSIYGLKLNDSNIDKYKLIVGILWSSFARYYFFSTTANWGLWNHKILLNELLQLPVVLDEKLPITKTIISIVDKLRNYHPKKQDLTYPNGVLEEEIEVQRNKWEAELDEAVYELYGLSEEQRDLIRDCCEVTLPFFYKPFNSIGAMQAVEKNDLSWIEKYVHIFCRRWNAYLGDGEEMRAKVHLGAHDNMVAVEFFPADKGDPWNLKSKNDSWGYILEQLGNTLPQPMGTSQIVLDGLVHVVSDSGIIIIKRNEKRFWTHSLAREDAMPKERRSR
ncbi:MAG: N-6 DNA methylase [Deltaproteobacteria bacterium]|nr:N-6 DNA methylase [Deltaproteobacteria bacterium]